MTKCLKEEFCFLNKIKKKIPIVLYYFVEQIQLFSLRFLFQQSLTLLGVTLGVKLVFNIITQCDLLRNQILYCSLTDVCFMFCCFRLTCSASHTD